MKTVNKIAAKFRHELEMMKLPVRVFATDETTVLAFIDSNHVIYSGGPDQRYFDQYKSLVVDAFNLINDEHIKLETTFSK